MGLLGTLGFFFCKVIRVIVGDNGFKYLFSLYWRLAKRNKVSRFGLYDLSHDSDLQQLNHYTSDIEKIFDYRRTIKDKETDSMLVFGANSKNVRFLARISVNAEGHTCAWLNLWFPDGRTFRKAEGQVYNAASTTDDCFFAGGLRMRCLLPFRKWKISFNGTLQETDCNVVIRDVHARLSFIWTGFATPHDLKNDITPTAWAEFYSEQMDFSIHSDILNDLDCIVQGGTLVGSINIDGVDETDLCLFGSRKRSIERNQPDSPDHLEVIVSTQEGQMFHVGHLEFPMIKSKLKYGYAVVKNARFTYINTIKCVAEGSDIKRINLFSDLWDFELRFDKPGLDFCYPVLETNYGVQVKIVPVTTNDDVGTALILHHSRGTINAMMQKPSVSLPRIIQKSSRDMLVIPFNEANCCDKLLTGGKGSSLGFLYYLKDKVEPEYSVPNGLVVTTNAYEEFSKAINISREVKQLEAVAWTNKCNEEIEAVCKKVVTHVAAQKLPLVVTQAIEAQLHILFKAEVSKMRFAVRSSASGEDSEEMSAAGQMKTFLGVTGVNKIMEAIVGCWASQFSFTAIQYKRQNGQLLNSPMAVVIQEMVTAEVSGVMFTCDPVTGNPKSIVLTANYGIGESVVSASADPDTMVFERSGDTLPVLTLKSTVVGGKATQFVMRDNGGLEEVAIEDSQRQICSLTTGNGQDLALIAVKLEEIYGYPLDLEWSITGGGIYLLQARPITTIDQDSDDFLEIETHSAFRQEKEYFSRANVGEVMSGSLSPFGMSCLFKAMTVHTYRYYVPRDKNMFNYDQFAQLMDCQYYYQSFFRMNDYVLRFFKKGERSFVTESIMIGCFGRLLFDEENDEMLELATKKNKFYLPTSTIRSLYYILKDTLFCKSYINQDAKTYRNKSIKVNESDSAAEMMASIFRQFIKMHSLTATHMGCTMTTTFVNCAVMHVLVSSAGGWKTEVFNDLSRILSSCPDVESANVPAAIEALARTIIQSPFKEKFSKLTKESALEWLLQTESEPGDMFTDFLQRHGHRCVNEFDVHVQPWGTDPLPLVETIQEMVRNLGEARAARRIYTTKEIIKGLSIPLSWKNRLLLRFLIPLSQRCVGCRELSKSQMVNGYNLLRQAYAKVAQKMVLEGRLPEADLFYYLITEEIGVLLETRSPKLIQKAIRRRALFPKINAYKFPEILSGFPKPINKVPRQNVPVEASFTMKGTPVSEGFIKARCRVAISLEEAKQIQQGEILITYGTDIGWSPYFPMLSGVATELGGLVSHGAVVAREYGLPCVVGVHGATGKFRSGDLVVLDGTKGLLQKVEE